MNNDLVINSTTLFICLCFVVVVVAAVVDVVVFVVVVVVVVVVFARNDYLHDSQPGCQLEITSVFILLVKAMPLSFLDLRAFLICFVFNVVSRYRSVYICFHERTSF